MSDARESPPLGGLATLVVFAFVQAMATPRWGTPLRWLYGPQPSLLLAVAAGAAFAALLVDALGFRRTLALASLAWIVARIALTGESPVVFTNAGPLFDPHGSHTIVLFIERFCYHACLAACLIGAARFAARLRGGPLVGVALVAWAAACAPRVWLPHLGLPAEIAIAAIPLVSISFLRPARPAAYSATVGGGTAVVLLVASMCLLSWAAPFVVLEELFGRIVPMSFEQEWAAKAVDAARATAGSWLAALVAFMCGRPTGIHPCMRTSLVAIALLLVGATSAVLFVDFGDATSLWIGLVQQAALALVHAAALAVAITRGGVVLRACAFAASAATPAFCVTFLGSYEAGWIHSFGLASGSGAGLERTWTGAPFVVLGGIYGISVVAFVVAFRRTTPGPVSSNDDGAAQVDDPVASRESDRRD